MAVFVQDQKRKFGQLDVSKENVIGHDYQILTCILTIFCYIYERRSLVLVIHKTANCNKFPLEI